MSDKKRILVGGATGHLGGFAVREFKSRGWFVRALARAPHKLESIDGELDEVVKGEVTDPASIQGICDGMDVVFSSIGITRQKDGLTYMNVDYQGNLNLLREAQRAGSSKFIYVSVLNADKLKDLEIVRAKVRFEEELKASGMNYTIVRPNGFFSDMLEYLKMAEKGKGYVFGSGEYRINPIHGQDLARLCADTVEGDEREIDAGGPDILTHNQILALAFDACGKPLKVSRVPIWLKKVLIKGMRAVTSVRTYGPLEFFMTVLAMDMTAPRHGEHRLNDYFKENESRA